MREEDRLNQNMAVLANLNDLITNTILNIAGNEISNAIDGKLVRRQDLQQTVAVRMQANLARHLPPAGQ